MSLSARIDDALQRDGSVLGYEASNKVRGWEGLFRRQGDEHHRIEVDVRTSAKNFAKCRHWIDEHAWPDQQFRAPQSRCPVPMPPAPGPCRRPSMRPQSTCGASSRISSRNLSECRQKHCALEEDWTRRVAADWARGEAINLTTAFAHQKARVDKNGPHAYATSRMITRSLPEDPSYSSGRGACRSDCIARYARRP